MKLYSYIGIGLGCVKIFPLGGIQGEGPLNVNLGLLIILEITGARKLKLKTIGYGKVLASSAKIFLLGGVWDPLISWKLLELES